MRVQIAQLARHLRERQEALDRRESALHVKAAELANQQRGMRLWIAEKHLELAQREKALQGGPARGAAQSPGDLCPEGGGLTRESQEQLEAARLQRIEQRREQCEQMVQKALSMLEARRARLEQEFRAWETRRQAPDPLHRERERQLEAMAAAQREREERLARCESLLAQQRRDMEDRNLEESRRVARLRELWQKRLGQQQSEFQEQNRKLQRERQRLQNRAEALEARAASLAQLREELITLHREALELRMATEETWAQLRGEMAPAALTQSLARIRARLAEYYRLADDELQARRDELRELDKQLHQHHQRLAQYRDQIEQWSTRRQEEIERHAKRLVARELELESQESRLEQIRAKWFEEKRSYQEEIRRLLRSQGEAACAPR